MKKMALLVFVLIWLLGLGAEEIALRQAFNLDGNVLHARSTDNCELIFWTATVGLDSDIFVQKLNPSGQALWGEAVAVVSHIGDQKLLAVVPSSDNNFILLWAEYDIETVTQLRIQKVSSNGQRLWPETGVQISIGEMNLENAFLVPNYFGGAFVVYHNFMMDNTITGQNVDTWGNQLWPAGGLQLVSDTSYLNLQDVVSDGEGGLIVNIWKYHPTTHNYLLRFSPQGTILGNNPLYSTGAPFQLTKSINGQFVISQTLANQEPGISFTKIDNMGNLLLPQPVSYPLDYYYQVNLIGTVDGGVILCYQQYSSEFDLQLALQRFDANFLPLWQAGGIELTSGINNAYGVSLAENDNGSILVSWNQHYTGNDMPTAKAQFVSPNGVQVWPNGGYVLTTGYGSTAVSIGYQDRGLFIWNAKADGMMSIRRQVVNSGGTLFLDPNGETLVQQINGQAYLFGSYTLSERFISVWTDTRNLDHIYYQINNTNLQPLLQDNGRALNPTGTISENLLSVQKSPVNTLAILYSVADEDMYRYYVQQINSNGETVYPERGILVYGGANMLSEMKMSFVGEDIYLGWPNPEYNNRRIIGQRIANGQKMWGENGRNIVTPETMYYSMEGLLGSYFLWRTYNYSQGTVISKVLRVDENGYPAPGWNATGMDVVSGQTFAQQDVLDSGLVDGDLIVFMNSYNGSANLTSAQKISSSGQRLWQDAGVAISADEEYDWISDVIYGETTAFLLTSPESIRFQKLSYNGESLLSPTDGIIADELNNIYDAKLVKLADGSYLCAYSDNDGAWIQNRDIYVRQIDPNGIPMGDNAQLFCGARYEQRQISAAAIGNKAMFAWIDDRAGIIDKENAITGIWAKSYNSTYVGVDDPTLSPVAKPALHANYPNPFNPSTTISFSLPDKGIAQLSVYNLKGQLVNTLLNQTELNAGEHSIVWNGCDANGKTLGSGVYFSRLSFAGMTIARKMVLAK
jgi:hypothetical protein